MNERIVCSINKNNSIAILMDKDQRKASRYYHATSGAIAGITAASIVQPLDVVKTRQQQRYVSGAPKLHAITIAKKVYYEEGLTTLWRGLGASLVRVSCGSALYFICLNSLSSGIGSMDAKGKISASSTLMIGAIARGVAATLVAPVTVVKTRLESNRGGLYSNTANAVVTIAKVEGFPAFFRGLGTTLLRDCPYSALYIYFYTRLKPFLYEQLQSEVVVKKKHLPLAHVLAGGLSAASATLLTHPPDVLKTRLQLQSSDHRFNNSTTTFSATFQQVIKERGFMGFFAGVWPRVLKRGISGAITWGVYEQVFQMLTYNQQIDSI